MATCKALFALTTCFLGLLISCSGDDYDDRMSKASKQLCCKDDLQPSTASETLACTDRTEYIFANNQHPRVTCMKKLFGTADDPKQELRKRMCTDSQEKYVSCLSDATANNEGYKAEFVGESEKITEFHMERLECIEKALSTEPACKPDPAN